MAFSSPVRLVVSSSAVHSPEEPLYITNVELPLDSPATKLPLLANCCCGAVSLRSGTLCIALLSMVDSVTGFLLTTALYDTVNNLLPFPAEELISDEEEGKIKLITLIVSGMLDLIQCVLSVLLFYGAKEQKSNCLAPWMVLYSVAIPVSLAALLVLATLLFLYAPFLYGVGALIFCAATTLVPTYFLLVVYSFYRELEETGPQDPTVNKEVFTFPRRYSKEHVDPMACV